MYVCAGCIGDKLLAQQVSRDGTLTKCGYCSLTCHALTIEELSKRIHTEMEEHFELTPRWPIEPDEVLLDQEHSWERRGNYVAEVIATVAGLNTTIADDVRAHLSDRFGYLANPHEGEEDPYNPSASYEERQTDTADFRRTWSDFRDEIQSRTRFFGAGTKSRLDEIFADLDSLITYYGEQVIREIQPGDNASFIWRGRTAYSQGELESILKSPSSQLGPPPSSEARAGRMNAQGIPVFYGALNESTCISEVRAPVGSHVVIGKFEVMKPLRVLAFDALSEVYSDVSYFDPNYTEQRSREAFLKQLVVEMSRPIMPQDETLEYLATQVVSEYLANRINPPIHGMIFPSSQTGGVGRNLVLFREACSIEPPENRSRVGLRVELPRPRRIGTSDESDEYLVLETQPYEGMGKTTLEESGASAEMPTRVDPEEQASGGGPTLRLEMRSVKVLDITGVTYEHYSYPVRHIVPVAVTFPGVGGTLQASVSVRKSA